LSRIALIKVQPNEELYCGIESACRKAGISSGLILSSTGSLNDAWLLRPCATGGREEFCVSGPGLEIAGLSGEVGFDPNGCGTSVFTGWVTRDDTTVTGGEFVRGRNIVCITYEIFVQEWVLPVAQAAR
jgi:predicted DNA-binding protein with PD1-like motif